MDDALGNCPGRFALRTVLTPTTAQPIVNGRSSDARSTEIPSGSKRYHRIATRYEKLAATYLTVVTIACILEWL